MEKIKISEIIRWCSGKPNKNFNDFYITGISTDTRTLKKNDLFIALKGEKFDGHDFVIEAFKKGASCCIVEKEFNSKNGLFIKVENTLLALGDISKNYRKKFETHIIGITGSDGKTTTKEIIKRILSTKYETCGTIGNFNNEIGLPISLLQLTKKTAFGVFELGMNKKGEIDYLSKILSPNSCIITNIGTAHIGFFKSRREIAEAKGEIFENRINNGYIFLNRDDHFFSYLKKKLKKANIVNVGVKKDADISGKIYQEEIDFFIFESGGEKYRMNFWNTSFIYSGLFGIAVGKKFGISEKNIQETLEEIKPVPGRGEVIVKDFYIIDESYNSNPNSLKNAILSLERKKFKRKIVIIGDMAELGKFSNFYHWYIGKILKKTKIDMVLTFGNESRLISKVSEKGQHFEEIEILKNKLKKIIKKGDVILVKGSRKMHLERIVDFLKMEI